MKFYVAAGSYVNPDGTRRFALVSPSKGKPYVWPESHPLGTDGAQLGRLTRHHASLYEVMPDGKTLKLAHRGDLRDDDPRETTIDPSQAADVALATKAASKDLLKSIPEPEEECPNCASGTVGLEHGRLVCRGECGHDFGPPTVATMG